MKLITTFRTLLLLAGLLGLSYQSFAASSLTIRCDDNNGNTENCRIEQDGFPVTQNLVDFAKTMINYADNPSSTASCSSSVGGSYSHQCNVADQLTIACKQPSTGSAECDITDNNFVDLEVLKVSCNSNPSDKHCTLTSSPENLTNALQQGNTSNDPNSIALTNAFLSCLNLATYGSLSDTCGQILSDIQSGDYDAAAQALAALRPIDPEIATEMAVLSINQTMNNIFNRLGDLRRGSTDTAQNAQYFYQNQWLDAGAQLAQGNNIQSDAAPSDVTVNMSEYGKLGIFLNASVTDGEYKKSTATDDISASTITLGLDYRFSENTVGGVAFNINQQSTDFDVDNSATSGEVDAEGFSAVTYGSYYINNWYIDGAFNFGGSNIEQERSPTSGEKYSADYSAGYYALSLATGYDFSLSNFNITPFIQYDIGTVDIDDYREKTKSGDPMNAISIKEQSRDIGALTAGSYFRYIIPTTKGVFIPEASIRLVKDNETDSQTITGRFIANTAPGSEFELTSTELDDSYAVIGLGFSFQLKSGNAGFVSIESVEAYDGLDQNRFSAGWRWEI